MTRLTNAIPLLLMVLLFVVCTVVKFDTLSIEFTRKTNVAYIESCEGNLCYIRDYQGRYAYIDNHHIRIGDEIYIKCIMHVNSEIKTCDGTFYDKEDVSHLQLEAELPYILSRWKEQSFEYKMFAHPLDGYAPINEVITEVNSKSKL